MKDIGLDSLSARSRICCKILLGSKETYTTFEIRDKEPTVHIRVTTSIRKFGIGYENITYNNTHRFSRTGDRATDKDITIKLKLHDGFDKASLLGNRYYNSELDDTVLVTENPINSNDEYDVDKHGWLKVEDGEISTKSSKKMKVHLNATVQQCATNDAIPTFTGYHGSAPRYRTLQSKFSTSISSARRNKAGKVEVNYLQPVATIILTQPAEQDFVVHTDVVSKVTNFTAVLHMNENSNRELILTLNNTSGLLKANLTAGGKSEIFRLLVAEGTTQYKYPGIAVECVENHTSLCLEAIWQAQEDLSKQCDHDVKCDTIDLSSHEGLNPEITYEKIEKDSILNPLSWLKYANPAEWFNGIDSAAEGFIVVVVVICIIILLAVISCFLRCCCCFYNCCKCLKCKKRRRDSYNLNNRGQDTFRSTEL